MGKSSKKIKNDRINTLRKQYDAFLEEDKKRRERNEYILGKLDKMRSASALVPISAQGSYHLEVKSPDVYMPLNNIRKRPDNYLPYLELRHTDESTILREISKKYILIPKRTAPIESVYTYRSEAIDDNDWKTKYNILDDLKKQEKGEHTDTIFNLNNKMETDTQSDINHKQVHNLDSHSKQPTSDKNNEPPSRDMFNTYEKSVKINETSNLKKSGIDIQERDIEKLPLHTVSISSNEELKVKDADIVCNTNLAEESHKYSFNETYEEKHDLDGSEKNKVSTNHLTQNIDNNLQKNAESVSRNNNSQMSLQQSVNQSYYNQTPVESSDYVSHEIVSEALYSNQTESNTPQTQDTDSSYLGKSPSDVKAHEINAVELLDQSAINSNKNQKDASEIEDKTSTETKGYGVEVPNHEGQLESAQIAYDPVEHYDTVQENTTEVVENTEHHNTGHVDHDSEINAFEVEQKEMFYSEQTGGDTYAYNEGGDNTIGEYTEEGYQQNDQYAYYEGVQQEQAYATNINEHEESTERYDPHYDQQYEGSYENQHTDKTLYDNTNAYDQQQFQEGNYGNEQLENVVNYENQHDNASLYQQEKNSNEFEAQENVIVQDNQMYDQQFYTEESDTLENIEQQLITEEGVMQNTPINIEEMHKENEGESKTIMDVANSAEHISDPKLS